MKIIRRTGTIFPKERLSAAEGSMVRRVPHRHQAFARHQTFPVKTCMALLCLLLLGSVPLPVYAAGITEQEASLQVEIFAQSDDGKSSSPVSGASLIAVRIASLNDPENSDTDLLYTVTDAAAKAGITDADIKGMDAAASSAVAAKAASAFKTGRIGGEELRHTFIRKAVSDDRGAASFGAILREHFGIFVVYQTGKNRDAAKYLDIEPFLIQVPQPDAGKDGAWEYQVRTIPKLAKHTPVPDKPVTPEKPQKPSTPTTPSKTAKKTTGTTLKGSTSPVKTGDLQNPVLWAGVFASAGLLLIVFAVLRKRIRCKAEQLLK